MSRQIRVVAFSVLGFGGVASIIALIFSFGDWFNVVAAAVTGVMIGVFAAPSIEPKAFKRAWLYETGAGCVTGTLLGLLLGSSVEAVVIGALLGATVGYLTPFWIKHAA